MKPSPHPAMRTEAASEIDLRALGAALKRRRRVILLPTLLAFILVSIFVNVVTPRYTAETAVLLENQETFFTRPERANALPDQVSTLDPEAVASQVQLISSRDIARRAIKQLQLTGNTEFDPLASGLGPLSRVLILLGIMPDPTRESVEARIVTKFLERENVYSPPKTRVIVIQFTSRDSQLAMRAADTIAQLYLEEQSAAKRETAKRSAEALSAQVTDLREKLAAADADREQYRVKSGLLAGSSSMTLSGQQLADINTDLSKARTAQADAQAKASLIRELIRDGKATDVTDVINNDIVRRVADNRVLTQTQLARELRTLLPGHPRIKELTAQLAEYDVALKNAAKQAAISLENEAKIAGQRVTNLENVLGQQKKVAGLANADEVHLRALERVAQTYKEQLENSSTKYQEALARQDSMATPSDARIISNASRPQEPSFPKKVPFIVFGTVAAFVLSVGFVVASELLSGRAALESVVLPRAPQPAPAEARAASASRPRRRLSGDELRARSNSNDPVIAPAGAEPSESAVNSDPSLAESEGLAATALARLKAFSRSAAAERADKADAVKSDAVGAEDNKGVARNKDDEAEAEDLTAKVDVSGMVDRIVAAHVPGRGLHIVTTDLDEKTGLTTIIELGRALSKKGRAIVADLNPRPDRLAILAEKDGADSVIADMHGLADLLAGDASFAEVIHRDATSRLHFIPSGQQEADFRDFDLILDALSETYDFILLLTPAFPESEIAKVMAPYADFIVLTGTEATGGRSIADLVDELTEAGACEVLVAGSLDDMSKKVA